MDNNILKVRSYIQMVRFQDEVRQPLEFCCGPMENPVLPVLQMGGNVILGQASQVKATCLYPFAGQGWKQNRHPQAVRRDPPGEEDSNETVTWLSFWKSTPETAILLRNQNNGARPGLMDSSIILSHSIWSIYYSKVCQKTSGMR